MNSEESYSYFTDKSIVEHGIELARLQALDNIQVISKGVLDQEKFDKEIMCSADKYNEFIDALVVTFCDHILTKTRESAKKYQVVTEKLISMGKTKATQEELIAIGKELRVI